MMQMFMEFLKRFFACTCIVLIVCEYLIYNIVIYQCSWPILPKDVFKNGKYMDKSEDIRAIILSDPHLLGWQHGHWFDKLRREWQMRRSFQTAVKYFQPDVVFILGDIFDEGMICNDKVSGADSEIRTKQFDRSLCCPMVSY